MAEFVERRRVVMIHGVEPANLGDPDQVLAWQVERLVPTFLDEWRVRHGADQCLGVTDSVVRGVLFGANNLRRGKQMDVKS